MKIRENIDIGLFFKAFKEMGFVLNDKTGGSVAPINTRKIEVQNHPKYAIHPPHYPKIIFLPGSIFLKTIKQTEKSLKVKLFVQS